MRFTGPIACLLLSSHLLLSGCDVLRAAMEEQVEADVRKRAGPGQIPPEPPVILPEPIVVNSLLPNRGPTTGGTFVEILGLNFQAGLEVYFGDLPANPTDTVVLGDNRIQTLTPPGTLGVVTLTVRVPTVGKGTLDGAFDYFEPVSFAALSPARGPSDGGTRVTLTGGGFVSGTTVSFGSAPPVQATVIDPTRAEVTTPPMNAGLLDVIVANGNGSAELNQGFQAFARVHLDAIAPFAGPLAGGTALTLQGVGFVNPSTVVLGGSSLTATTNLTETALATTSPAGTAEGPVDVSVSNETGSSSLTRGFTYIDQANPTGRVVALVPSVGLLAGGNTVRLSGRGFEAGALDVDFGGRPAACEVHSDWMVSCLAPSGEPGAVPVRVQNAGMDLLLPNAYTYINLTAEVPIPNVGALAGGTYVKLYGDGFGGTLQVRFGDALATDLEILSTHVVALRTPPRPAGPHRGDPQPRRRRGNPPRPVHLH